MSKPLDTLDVVRRHLLWLKDRRQLTQAKAEQSVRAWVKATMPTVPEECVTVSVRLLVDCTTGRAHARAQVMLKPDYMDIQFSRDPSELADA